MTTVESSSAESSRTGHTSEYTLVDYVPSITIAVVTGVVVIVGLMVTKKPDCILGLIALGLSYRSLPMFTQKFDRLYRP